MMRMIPALALTVALGTVACGATTNDPGAPVSKPPTSTGPVQQRQPQQPQQPQQSRQGPSEIGQSARGVIPAGQELDVRLQSTLNSGTAQAEQRFETTTVVDLTQDGVVLVPAGSQVRGVVSSAKAAGRVDRVGSMTLTFDQLSVAGRRELPIRGMATQIFESGGLREDVDLPAGSIIRIRLDSPVTVR